VGKLRNRVLSWAKEQQRDLREIPRPALEKIKKQPSRGLPAQDWGANKVGLVNGRESDNYGKEPLVLLESRRVREGNGAEESRHPCARLSRSQGFDGRPRGTRKPGRYSEGGRVKCSEGLKKPSQQPIQALYWAENPENLGRRGAKQHLAFPGY